MTWPVVPASKMDCRMLSREWFMLQCQRHMKTVRWNSYERPRQVSRNIDGSTAMFARSSGPSLGKGFHKLWHLHYKLCREPAPETKDQDETNTDPCRMCPQNHCILKRKAIPFSGWKLRQMVKRQYKIGDTDDVKLRMRAVITPSSADRVIQQLIGISMHWRNTKWLNEAWHNLYIITLPISTILHFSIQITNDLKENLAKMYLLCCQGLLSRMVRQQNMSSPCELSLFQTVYWNLVNIVSGNHWPGGHCLKQCCPFAYIVPNAFCSIKILHF